MVSAVGTIFGTTGLIEISKSVDIKWIFVFIGAFSVIVSGILFFIVKDMNTKKP